MKTEKTAGAAINAPIQEIRIADIIPDPRNRKDHDPVKLAGLAEEIRTIGLLQPIVVRPIGLGDPEFSENLTAKFMIIAGERRWLAHGLLKRETIQARVFPNAEARDRVRQRHAENFHREDLTPIQRAESLKEMLEAGWSQAEVAGFIGAKDQSTVSNLCRLLALPDMVKGWLNDGSLSAAHGKALLRFDGWPRLITAMAELAVEKGASSKSMEKGVPFANELDGSGNIFTFDYDVCSKKDLPPEYRDNPAILEAEDRLGDRTVYCLDPNLGRTIANQIEAEAVKGFASVTGGSSAKSGGGMTPAEAAARKKKITENKAARAAVEVAYQKALQCVKKRDDATERSLANVVIEAALADGRHGNRIEEAAKALGLTVPRGESSGLRTFSFGAMHKTLCLYDALALAALAVMMRERDDAKRFASEVPDSLAHVSAGFHEPNSAPVPEPGKKTVIGGVAGDLVTPVVQLAIQDLVKKGKSDAEIAKTLQLHVSSVALYRKVKALKPLVASPKLEKKVLAIVAKVQAKNTPAKKPAKAKPADKPKPAKAGKKGGAK